MSHELQSLVVMLIVFVAAYSIARRILARGPSGNSSSCGNGCGSCSAAKEVPLVQLSPAPRAGNAGENGS